MRDALDKAADDLREALDGCIKHCAATVETHQRSIEAAAQKATESQRALEQAQSSAQLSSFSDDASGDGGDQLLEWRKTGLVQKKERLLQR